MMKNDVEIDSGDEYTTLCPALSALLLTSVPRNALMGEREAWISAFVVEPHANW